MSSREGRLVVAVVAAAADSEVKNQLTSALAENNFALTDSPTGIERAAVVLIVSSAALNEDVWVTSVEAIRDCRIVPVVHGEVPSSGLPQHVSALNWIQWDEARPVETIARIFLGIQTDLSRYREARSLEAQAASWQAAGRPKSDLIESWGEAKAASDRLHGTVAGALGGGSGAVDDFVSQSLAYARRGRRRLAFRWFRRAVAALVAFAVVVVGVVDIHNLRRTNKLRAGVTNLADASSRPDLEALKLVDLVVNGLQHHDLGLVTIRELANVLSVPWAQGVIGANFDSPINDVVYLPGERMASVDGKGSIAWWSLLSGNVVQRRAVSDRPLFVVDATSDGSVIAAAGQSSLHVVTTQPWSNVSIPFDGVASGIAVSATGAVAVATTTQLSYALPSSSSLRKVGVYKAVLSLQRQSDGGLAALVRKGRYLELIDPRSGHVIKSRAWPKATFERAALASDGEVVVTGAAHELWWASSGLRFKPTGQYVPDVLDSLLAMPGGRIAYSSATTGTQVVDLANNLEVGPICPELTVVSTLVASVHDESVSCVAQGLADLNTLIGRLPVGAAHQLRASTFATSSTGPVRSIRVLTDGLVQVSLAARAPEGHSTINLDPQAIGVTMKLPAGVSVLWQPGGPHYSGRTTTVAIAPGGRTFALGSSNGVVDEVDVASPTSYAVVSRWVALDHAPVQRVSWSADESALRIATDTSVWTARSCAGCFIDLQRMVDQVADRRWICYLSGTVGIVDGDVAELLRLEECSRPPRPAGVAP